jgi:hypothetical protein
VSAAPRPERKAYHKTPFFCSRTSSTKQLNASSRPAAAATGGSAPPTFVHSLMTLMSYNRERQVARAQELLAPRREDPAPEVPDQVRHVLGTVAGAHAQRFAQAARVDAGRTQRQDSVVAGEGHADLREPHASSVPGRARAGTSCDVATATMGKSRMRACSTSWLCAHTPITFAAACTETRIIYRSTTFPVFIYSQIESKRIR